MKIKLIVIGTMFACTNIAQAQQQSSASISYSEQMLQNMVGALAGDNARCNAQIKDLSDRLQKIMTEKAKIKE